MIIYTKSSGLKTFKLSSTLQESFFNFLFVSFFYINSIDNYIYI